ncbi:MAG TPA: hypothetical protein VGC92_14280 [Phenylobacterium sp.]|jgi:hypothetical protein
MQLSSFAAAAAALFIAAPAFAAPGAFHAEASLANAAGPSSATIGNAAWRCDAGACVGEAANRGLDNPVRECRKVAAVLGPLSAYQTRGVKLEAGDLKACNMAAAKGGDATAAK